MTQDLHSLSPLQTAHKSSLEDVEACGEGPSLITSDIGLLREQLRAAQDSIKFLQSEHASLLKGLHEEVERLQDMCRDLQFRCEAGGCLLPDSDFFKCSPERLQQKVDDLIRENRDLKRRLAESHQAIDILDQKEKLALWQHHQELEQRDSAISRLERELESKCAAISQLASTSSTRRKRGTFWRRFGFVTGSQAEPVPTPKPNRVEHLSKEDLPSEIQSTFESQYQSYSSYSSLSDKSISDDEGFGPDPKSSSVRLPPILPPNSKVVRHQLRVNSSRVAADHSMAIDQIQTPELAAKRVSKA